MFELTRNPIDVDAIRRALADPAAGALATFEGWVRNQNAGRAVQHLEYESYDALALKAGQAILDEAFVHFDILGVRCIHRVGRLGVGEMAVLVAVAAAHRREALEACQFIIDELKHRVPVWKKEFYANGDSGWVQCDACANHGEAAWRD